MSEEAKFKAGAHRSLVTASAAEIGIRNTQLMVLMALLDVINFRNGQSRISRARLMEKLGRSEKAVKMALQALRTTGIIYPVAYPNGGHARCPVYCFRYTEAAVIAYNAKKPTGAKFTPLNVGDILNNGGKFFQQGGQIFPTTGVNFTPPSSLSYISKKEGASAQKVAPRRGGGDKAPCGGNGMPNDRLTELLKDHTYGQARVIMEKEAQGDGSAVA